MGKTLRYIIIAVLAALYVAFGAPLWLAGHDAPYPARATAYSFFHASIWHLAANLVAVWSVYTPRRKGMGRELALSFLIAVVVYPLSFRPVIGFSNILYATLGQRTPTLSSKWWRKSEVIIFIAITFALLFVPRFSALTHIFSFLAGMLIASVRRGIGSLLKDARRFIK